jgi:molecular chaperone DnaK
LFDQKYDKHTIIKEKIKMSKVLGIDLGTGFSCMAIMEAGEPKVIVNAEGARTTPSIVAWTKNGDRLVGQAAKRQAVTNPKNTVYEIKRFIGRKYDEVLDDIKLVSYDVVKADNGDIRVKINDKLYSPEEISSFILAKLKTDAEAFLGEKITDAVITVPAYFNDSQRQATKDAGTIAGLNVLRIVNEPTAAALSYGLDKQGNSVIAVADAGAGTYDTTILELGEGIFEVKATNGDTRLGGKDYDQAIMNWLCDEFKKENGIDLAADQMALQRLKDEAEKAKIALSTTESIEINIPFITADATGPKHLINTLSRAKFEALITDLNDRLVAPCKNCINDANVKVDKVILVGGTTRIPSVQTKIKDIFGIEPSKGVNADEVVACGAAVQGGVLKGEVHDVLLLDVTPLTLSICTNGQIATPMVPRNTTIPTKKTETFSNAVSMQPAATILIGQGERKMFSDNKLLGQFNVELTPMPNPGQNHIEITYNIDANGILTVEAFDKALNKKANITITSSSGLSKEEIEKAKADAEAHAAEDEKKLELVNEKNRAESLCNSIERAFKDVPADKITEDEKKPVIDAIAKVREVIKTDDIEKIKSEVEAMNKLYEPLATKLYAANDQPQFTQDQMEQMMKDPKFAQMFGRATTSTDNNSSDTVDAEFTAS